MNFLRKIASIIWKDTRLRFASPIEWLFFLILPVIFTLILSGGTGGSDESRIRFAVVDQAQTPLSARLITLLDESSSVFVEQLPLETAKTELEDGDVPAVLTIPAGFQAAEADLAQIGANFPRLELSVQPGNLSSLAVQQAVQAAVRRVSSEIEIASLSTNSAERLSAFPSSAERQAYYDQSLQAARHELDTAPKRITVSEAAVNDEIDYDPQANSSAGQLITWVFVPLLGISGMFAYERNIGSLRRLLTTPTRRGTFLLGAIGGQVLLALLQMLLLVGFGMVVLKLNWGHSPAALAVILIASALAAAAMGTALGTFVKTEGQAQSLSLMLGMLMALLGGCWYPLELFPPAINTTSRILPTRWAMQGMLDLVLRGQGLSGVLPEAAVLLGFAILFFTIGVYRFRYE